MQLLSVCDPVGISRNPLQASDNGTTLAGTKDKHREAAFSEDFENCHFGQFSQHHARELILAVVDRDGN